MALRIKMGIFIMDTKPAPVKKKRIDLRFEREAKALQKNLAKRKKQQEEREKLKSSSEQKEIDKEDLRHG